MNPQISILITTYNRCEKLKRALASIFAQTYTDYEIIIIDDASTDETPNFIDSCLDPRISYFRNAENQGRENGDRVHIKRFVNELAKGKYFLYLCDDDHLMFDTLLARQVALFEANYTACMVIGGQMSDFGDRTKFHENVYPLSHMTAGQFLKHFSENPITSNIIIGATLYHREKFIESGALQGEGAKWQSGYEMLMAPAKCGDVIYINEPCVMTEIRPSNASFQGTQKSQYLDCVKSIKAAQLPIDIEKRTIYNVGQSFLRNAEHIKENGSLTMCSAENIAEPVTMDDIKLVTGDL